MKISFYCPSLRRPEKSITQLNYPFVKLVVKEDEVKDYEENGNELVSCPNEIQGNLCRVRNWMIDNLMEDNECLILLAN